MDEKWDMVKTHYESAYCHPGTREKIRFMKRLEDSQIEFLYEQMKHLGVSERKHLDRKRLQERVHFL